METDYIPYLSKQKKPSRTSEGIAVTMTVVFNESGKPTPICIHWKDGRQYNIDMVLEMKPIVHDGIYYVVEIKGQCRKLHFVNNTWFIL